MKFQQLYEQLNSIKTVKTIRYPKQIVLSEQFKQVLKQEIKRHMQLFSEASGTIQNFDIKFLKAIQFMLHEMKQAPKIKKGVIHYGKSGPHESKKDKSKRPERKWKHKKDFSKEE